MADPWERRDGEGDEAWQAFQMYRDMGLTRSTAKVGKELVKSRDLMLRWSAHWDWVARVQAWDVEQDRVWVLEQKAARRAMARRHVSIAGQFQAAVVERLKTFDSRTMKARDLALLMDTAAKLERAALGEPDQRVQVSGQLDTGLTDEERLARLDALQREAQRRVEEAGGDGDDASA